MFGIWYTCGQWADVSCIPESGCYFLFVSFISFFLFNFQTLKFCHTFLRNCEARRLKLVTHLEIGGCIVYTEIMLLPLFITLFLHFSFSPIFKQLSHFFQELWGLDGWNLFHIWTVGRCIVYTGIGLLLLIRPFISFFFFLPNFQTLKCFVTLFSGTVRPRRLKLGTHVEMGDVSCLPESCCCTYSSLYFFIFLSLQFSSIKDFPQSFLGNCEA